MNEQSWGSSFDGSLFHSRTNWPAYCVWSSLVGDWVTVRTDMSGRRYGGTAGGAWKKDGEPTAGSETAGCGGNSHGHDCVGESDDWASHGSSMLQSYQNPLVP